MWKLVESSAVAEGEAPPLQERGVVGLHLVESASFLRETAPSHLNVADLERGCLIPHRSGTTALGGDLSEEEDDAACDCFNRTRSWTTTMSSVIAALIHSSLAIMFALQNQRLFHRERERENTTEIDCFRETQREMGGGRERERERERES